MVHNVIESYWKLSAGKKTMVFNVNLNHNAAVYNAFRNEGLNVYSITGDTEKKERSEILQKFKVEKDAIICNVGVLTAGFDEPTIETIILNRATKSLSLYLQMIGRGSRPSENKSKFNVIDLGKNTVRHGYYDDYFDWLLVTMLQVTDYYYYFTYYTIHTHTHTHTYYSIGSIGKTKNVCNL